ncbi:MFS transporter [Amycolatopsis sp. H20-H5]|uniref:MFS transporter n=1 Tax=Amycolatopsis sp. H20-H5 TaxID=3046309 RepID=UPI002DB755AA|nr:MFS transporter [Amycolatopsis sp. H20-H5]MEC3979012.1 MFS transporter [Amycolatopsis sp. H20-H5]
MTLPGRRRRRSLAVLLGVQWMITLDATVVNVALDAIGRELAFSAAGLAWVVNGYLVAFAGFQLVAGRLGDLWGAKRVFLAGVVVFTAASLWCGLAGSPVVLVAARFVQGVGAAVASAVILALIAAGRPGTGARTRAIGFHGFVGAAGASAGLLVGGVVTDAVGWHWIFLINVPAGVLIVFAGIRLLDDGGARPTGGRVDALGGVLVTGALLLAVCGLIDAGAHGWTSARSMIIGLVVMLLVGAFLLRQALAESPLVPPALLAARSFPIGGVVRVLVSAGAFGQFFVETLYLQRVLGYDASAAGFAFVPLTLVNCVFSLWISRRLCGWLGELRTLAVTLALLVAGLLLYAVQPLDATYPVDVLPAMVLIGAGIGGAWVPMVKIAIDGAPASDYGVASGLLNTAQQAGAALGIAAMAGVASTRTGELRATGALADGYRLSFVVAAILVASALPLLVLLSRRHSAGAKTQLPPS